ncbi:hypothetical protein [Arthrobacter alpinus]|nr:hypothetical protein [Arthrobacter alpinus]
MRQDSRAGVLLAIVAVFGVRSGAKAPAGNWVSASNSEPAQAQTLAG